MPTYLLVFASKKFCKKESLTLGGKVVCCRWGVPSDPVFLFNPIPASPFPLLAQDLYMEKEIYYFFQNSVPIYFNKSHQLFLHNCLNL